MKRLLAIAAVLLVVGGVNLAWSTARGLPEPPPPLAIDDPKTGDVVLWPGEAAEPAALELRVTPCQLGPATLPILSPENDA